MDRLGAGCAGRPRSRSRTADRGRVLPSASGLHGVAPQSTRSPWLTIGSDAGAGRAARPGRAVPVTAEDELARRRAERDRPVHPAGAAERGCGAPTGMGRVCCRPWCSPPRRAAEHRRGSGRRARRPRRARPRRAFTRCAPRADLIRTPRRPFGRIALMSSAAATLPGRAPRREEVAPWASSSTNVPSSPR